jgi:hypothetical protein
MFNPIYLRDLSCRLHLLARDCPDLQTAAELRKMVDEIRAKAGDAESFSFINAPYRSAASAPSNP